MIVIILPSYRQVFYLMAFAGVGYVFLLVLPSRIVHKLAFMICVCVCVCGVFKHYPFSSSWTTFKLKNEVVLGVT